jgi:N utilization substance protein A
VLDEEAHRIEVIVPDDQLSLAIGRRGQNVRLASMLTGWDIDIMTEAEESDRRTEEFRSRSDLFIQALDVDDVIAHLLVGEGFSSVEEIAYVDTEELAGIEGFDFDVASELQNRAKLFLNERDARFEDERRTLGVEDAVGALPHMNPAILVKLGQGKLKTTDDVADLAADELIEMVGADLLTEEQANEIIMAARAPWFAEEEGKAD